MFSYLPLPKLFQGRPLFAIAPLRTSSGLRRGSFGGFKYRVNDLVIAGASAKVARESVANLGLARMRVVIEQRFGRHQKAWSADAALEAPVLQGLLLGRMQ